MEAFKQSLLVALVAGTVGAGVAHFMAPTPVEAQKKVPKSQDNFYHEVYLLEEMSAKRREYLNKRLREKAGQVVSYNERLILVQWYRE